MNEEIELKPRSEVLLNEASLIPDAKGDNASLQIFHEHVSGNVTLIPFAKFDLSGLDRFYKSFDIIELDGQDYVFSCAVLASVNNTERAIVAVLNAPVAQYFDGKYVSMIT
jgi:hypothetical protein